MGFETQARKPFVRQSGMFEHTLWDLKRSRVRPRSLRFLLFEHTLWDLKLGFRCQQRLFIRFVFEHTLWDLKLKKNSTNDIKEASLNIPYGIWNSLPSYGETIASEFEHTLWDLKRIYAEYGSCEIFSVWTYPMGFETWVAPYPAALAVRVWTYPMGFETQWTKTWSERPRKFEHTLWDLKQMLDHPCPLQAQVWTYPMGFETGGSPPIHPKTRVWTYPMGFETGDCVQWNAPQKLCLNIPYGIWNTYGVGTLGTDLFQVWTYPMGFETAAWWWGAQEQTRFEHTLWDLKPRHWRRGWTERCRVWTYPMGFETPPQPSPAITTVVVWTYPMGFETGAPLWWSRVHRGLNIPYGIWNATLLQASMRSKTGVWTYPMGFETTARKKNKKGVRHGSGSMDCLQNAATTGYWLDYTSNFLYRNDPQDQDQEIGFEHTLWDLKH